MRSFILGMVIAATPVVASAADPMSDAKAILAAHATVPAFEAPGAAFDAKTCMAGKTVVSIPITNAVPFVVQLEKAMKKAAAEVGFTYEVWENQGKSDQWTQGVSNAIGKKAALIDLTGGLNAAVLGPQLLEARQAGIKISTTHLYDVTQEEAPSVDGSAKVDFTEAGRALAARAFVDTDGKPDVVIVGSNDVLPSIPFVKSIQATLKTLCPACKQTYVNVPVTEWATKIQSGVQSAMLADPGVNYILPIYDSMSQFVVPALRIVGGGAKVGVASFNGTPFVLDMIREGTVNMDLGESLGWAGYAAIDTQMRILCGLPVPAKLNVPLLIFDKANVASAGIPANFDDGYGDQHLKAFRRLWKLSGF